MSSIDSALGQLGLITPTRRFLAVAFVVGAVLYYAKPSIMFFDGVPRPWSLFGGGGDPDDGGIPATSLPWWLAAVIAGALAGTFL